MALELTPEEIVERLLDGVVHRIEAEVPWRPGARELLAELAGLGIPCGLVTMSYRRFVQPVLARLPERTFATVVTGDVVTNGKPHPEPYLTAAGTLGVAATDCLAIEDSNAGATSAGAAGCPVLVVPHHVVVEGGPGRVFTDSLEGLDAAGLAELWVAAVHGRSTSV
ncbi:MAG: HAD family hydrolase [Nocardioides sp.]